MNTGAGTFTPSSISNMLLWVKADGSVYNTGTTQATNGQTVDSIVDYSGNGYNMSYVGTPPLFTTNVQNGKPGIFFNAASSDRLKSYVVLSSAVLSVFVVATVASASASYGRLVSLTSAGSNDYDGTGYADLLSRDSSNQGLTGYRNANPLSVKSIPAYDTAFSAISVFDSVNQTTYVANVASGTPVASTGTFGTGTGGSELLAIGNPASGSPSPHQGYIFEVIVYTKALTSTDRSNLTAYATSKWGTP